MNPIPPSPLARPTHMQEPMHRGKLHLVIGPVGAGKSTFAARLGREHQAVCLNLDDWMATLFSPDRPDTGLAAWYVARADRCVTQIWKVALGLTEAGMDVVLEIGLIQQHTRDAFYARVDARPGLGLTVYVLDAPRDVRRERVRQRNLEQGATFSMQVPPHIFEMASDMWEPPSQQECEDRTMHFVPGTYAP